MKLSSNSLVDRFKRNAAFRLRSDHIEKNINYGHFVKNLMSLLQGKLWEIGPDHRNHLLSKSLPTKSVEVMTIYQSNNTHQTPISNWTTTIDTLFVQSFIATGNLLLFLLYLHNHMILISHWLSIASTHMRLYLDHRFQFWMKLYATHRLHSDIFDSVLLHKFGYCVFTTSNLPCRRIFVPTLFPIIRYFYYNQKTSPEKAAWNCGRKWERHNIVLTKSEKSTP